MNLDDKFKEVGTVYTAALFKLHQQNNFQLPCI